MADKRSITIERLREVLSYDPETGIFTWLVDRGKGRAGEIAGTKVKGYILITIDNIRYPAQILAWLWMTGELLHWPEFMVDHINLKKDNNWWDNLRKATSSENNWNSPISKNNACGYKGVYYFKGEGPREKPWRAEICKYRKRVWAGYFATAEEAHQARVAAIATFHDEFART